jgi:cytochrome c biogenesis protein CcdA
LGVLRRAQPRNNVSPAGVLAILGFVAVILAVTLPTGFALEAADVRYPATWGNVVAGALMVVGGPLLMRFLRHTMVATGGGQR